MSAGAAAAAAPPPLEVARLPTPVGELLVVTDRGGSRLRGVEWADREGRLRLLLSRQRDVARLPLEPAARPGPAALAVAAYLAGDLAAVDGLPVEAGGTPFQRLVWAELRAIPCGRTVTYGELARRVGRPAAVRAVGAANGANPVSVVVPCHRVVGGAGSLTGYAGGLDRKRWLLAHEGAAAAAQPRLPDLG